MPLGVLQVWALGLRGPTREDLKPPGFGVTPWGSIGLYRDNENKMETTISYRGLYVGLYWDNGKEIGNYGNYGDYRV